MADRIVQPKVLASTNPDAYDNLIMAQSKDATNVTTNINGKAISSIFESNGTTVKNATNVTTNINGKAISSIFESNGTTVKNATNATNATFKKTFTSYSDFYSWYNNNMNNIVLTLAEFEASSGMLQQINYIDGNTGSHSGTLSIGNFKYMLGGSGVAYLFFSGISEVMLTYNYYPVFVDLQQNNVKIFISLAGYNYTQSTLSSWGVLTTQQTIPPDKITSIVVYYNNINNN